ncbi:MAG: KH domain-containing protein [Firmicutes bacterium]|nr:KH domain-containing protein [Bacillota bacterium]
MKELVEFLAKSLVEHPEEVLVNEEKRDNETVYKLHVAAKDMGRVIGKQGRVAKALRTVVKAGAIKTGERVRVDIIDDEV